MRKYATIIAVFLVVATSAVPSVLDHDDVNYIPSTQDARGELVSSESNVGGNEPVRAVLDLPEGPLGSAIPAVVRVTSRADSGSGVIIDPAGLVMTNAHVVGTQEKVMVSISGHGPEIGIVIERDDIKDLALIQLQEGSYPYVPFSIDPDAAVGDPVFAVGYPLDLPGPATVTSGILSRVIEVTKTDRRLIQTDAPINAGNSGGPLLDSNGNILGIVTSSIFTYDQKQVRGLSFAVSAETIRTKFFDPSPEAVDEPAKDVPEDPSAEFYYEDIGVFVGLP